MRMRLHTAALALLVCAACGRTAIFGDETTLFGDDDASAVSDDASMSDGDPQFFDDGSTISDGGGKLDGSRVDGSVTCGPSNCMGCCDLDGKCTNGGGSTPDKCGSGGEACRICPPGYECSKSFCFQQNEDTHDCGAHNCEGCCWHYGAGFVYCVAGFDNTLCGRHGDSCQACDTSHGGGCVNSNGIGGSCQGTPPPCSPSTCNGCCYGQVCATGTQDIACGSGGAACTDCYASSLTCAGGACGP